jgi:hypothetical protein
MEYRTNEEMYIPAEYASRAKEYHTPAKETFVGTTKEKEKSGKTSLFQKTRKMGYLVVAAVATVTIAQAAAPAAASTGRQVDFSQISQWGAANGGVMPVEVSGGWGLMDLQGEMVCEPKFDEFYSNPNKDGYSVFFSRTDKSYYVLNNRGEEVFVLEAGEWYRNSREDTALVTDDNIIYISYGTEYVGYWTIDGELIYEATAGEGESISYSTPFHDGVAMVCWNDNNINSGQQLYMLSADGTLTEVADWENKKQTYVWRGDNYADGYILCHKSAFDEICLYNVENGELTPVINENNVYDDFLSAYERSGLQIDVYSMNNTWIDEMVGVSTSFISQRSRSTGWYLDHYETYACIKGTTTGSNRGSVLFDYNDANSETESLDRVIAVYDDIQLDDFPYLRANEGDDYFYIDYSGAVVSDTYAFATSFNDEGYAMVMDADGNAYLLNDSFEKLDTISGCTAIENCGQAFVCMIDDRETLYVPAGY